MSVSRVIVWTNGMVMVFDEHDHQVVNLQGYWNERRTRIEAAYQGEVWYMDWPDTLLERLPWPTWQRKEWHLHEDKRKRFI